MRHAGGDAAGLRGPGDHGDRAVPGQLRERGAAGQGDDGQEVQRVVGSGHRAGVCVRGGAACAVWQRPGPRAREPRRQQALPVWRHARGRASRLGQRRAYEPRGERLCGAWAPPARLAHRPGVARGGSASALHVPRKGSTSALRWQPFVCFALARREPARSSGDARGEARAVDVSVRPLRARLQGRYAPPSAAPPPGTTADGPPQKDGHHCRRTAAPASAHSGVPARVLWGAGARQAGA